MSAFLARIIDRPVAVAMATLAAVVFGLVSLGRLPMDLMPDLAWPTLTVRTDLPGAAPEEVENQIARPIETALATVSGIKSLESVSRAGRADVILRFDWGRNMDEASQTVRERLALIPLPPDAERPLLLRRDPDDRPVMRLAVRGDRPPEVLRELAERLVARRLEGATGVAAVTVRGGQSREILVELDPDLVRARGLTLNGIQAVLASHNLDMSGGELTDAGTTYLVRTLARLQDAEQIRELQIPGRNGARIRLADVATVSERGRPAKVVTRMDGEAAVEIAIYRSGGANLVDVSQTVHNRIFGTEQQRAFVEKFASMSEQQRKKMPLMMRQQMTNYIEAQLPDDLSVAVTEDQSTFVRTALQAVRSAAYGGALLAVLVLMVMLRNGRATAVIALSIPLSVAATFAPLYLAGVTLNLMSLGGLALVIGMLVDNSVVVLEAITRKIEEGTAPLDAALAGSAEVAGAVIASTFTTVSVFAPLAFVEGIAGQLFSPLAITVVVGLMASLLVSLTVVPTLAALGHGGNTDDDSHDALELFKVAGFEPFEPLLAHFAELRALGQQSADEVPATRALVWMRLKKLLTMVPAFANAILRICMFAVLTVIAALLRVGVIIGRLSRSLAVRLFGSLGVGTSHLLGRLEERYAHLLRHALTRTSVWLAAALLLFVAALVGLSVTGRQLLPEVAQGLLVARVDLKVGATLSESIALAERLETGVAGLEGVAAVHTVIGEEEGADAAGDKGPQSTEFWVTISPHRNPAAHQAKVRERLRALLAAEPGVHVRIEAPSLLDLPPPIEVAILSHDLERAQTLSAVLEDKLNELPLLRDVRRDLRPGYPEIRIRYRREALVAYGLELSTVSSSVRDLLKGVVATRIDREDQIIDLRLAIAGAEAFPAAQLGALNVNPAGTPPIRLDAVADLEQAIGPSEIRHLEGRRGARLTAALARTDLDMAIASTWQAVADAGLDPISEVELRGQVIELQNSARSLWLALALALFLVYAIMAAQFENLRAPLAILFAAPLSLVGVTITLLVLRLELSVLVFIGLIVLIGIVVNNAIVLITTVGQKRDEGLDIDDALVAAGRIRLRPILITTITTVLGLLPMAIGGGQGAEIRVPLAWTVMGGLVSSTILTLIIVPMVYKVLHLPFTSKGIAGPSGV